MLDFSAYRVLSFDCYGTLIDWETGILRALRPLLAKYHVSLPDDALLRLYGEQERKAQGHEPFITYREVLARIVWGVGDELGFNPTPPERAMLGASMRDWPPFPDTVVALRRLKDRYKLAIISNVDRDLFTASASLLQVPFDHVITSQDAGSYKPSEANFRYALERIGVPKGRVLHVAQSLYHDVTPAKALGLDVVWVNRSGAKSTPLTAAVPDVEVPDMKSLADLVEGAFPRG